MPERIIFDCDNTLGLPLKEVDDGLMLLNLLGDPQIELLGITTTFGNGQIEQVYAQTQKLKNRLQLDFPVLRGEAAPGQNPDTPAAHFLVETVNDAPQQITLLATGPLGNLYSASLLDPDFYAKLKQIVLMGGYLQPVRLGYRDLAELNFSANPEAALSVLRAPCPVTVFSAQACLDAPFGLKDICKADYWPGWLKIVLIQWLAAFSLYCGVSVFYLWDLLPAIYLTHPEIFNLRPFVLGSDLESMSRGMLIEDETGAGHEVLIATGINDQAAFNNLLNEHWRRAALEFPLKFG